MSPLLHGDTGSPIELLLRVEIQDGRGTSTSRECVVRQGDDIHELARGFCVSNELTDDRSPALLEEHIRSSLAVLERERSYSDKVRRCKSTQAASGASRIEQSSASVPGAIVKDGCRGADFSQHHSFVERLMSPPAEAGDMFAAESLEPLLQRCYEKIKSASEEGVTGLLPGLSDESGVFVGLSTSGASQMLHGSPIPAVPTEPAGTSAGGGVSHDDRAQREAEQRAPYPKYGVEPVVDVKDAEVETLRRGDLSSPLTRQEHLEVLRQQEEALEAAVARLALTEGLDACLSPCELSDSATASSGEACLALALERIHLIKSAVQSHNVSQGHILTLVDSLKEALQQSIITETKHRAPQPLTASLRAPCLAVAWSGARSGGDVSRQTRSRPSSAFIPQEFVDAGQVSAVMQPASAWQRPLVASSEFVRGGEEDHRKGMGGAATATRDPCESDEDKVRGEEGGSDPLGVDAEELLADAVDAAATTRQTVERYQRIVREEVGASPSRTMLHDALPRDDISPNDSDDEYGF